MLRSLTDQYARQSPTLPAALSNYYETQSAQGQRQASIATILDILQQLIAGFDTCFLLLDALDEFTDADRHKALSLLSQMVNWSNSKLHVFVTSRPELGLVEKLRSLADRQIDLSLFQKETTADIGKMLTASWQSSAQPASEAESNDLMAYILKQSNAK